LPDISKPFTVLGIESSCDDTGVSIVRSDGTVLSSVVYSQNDIHEKFGGIVPTLAMEQHKINIEVAVEEAVKKAGIKSLDEVDAIAVTKGPGLEICLRVGLRKAQALARELKKPFVTVHHLEAHCMMARLAGSAPSSAYSSSQDDKSDVHFESKVKFPFMVLLASGGHTSLLLCREMGEYTVLGGTYDDALGEAFDKAARQLGLRGASSGGVAIEQAAAAHKARLAASSSSSTASSSTAAQGGAGSNADRKNAAERGVLKVPMRDKANCDFSYAGTGVVMVKWNLLVSTVMKRRVMPWVGNVVFRPPFLLSQG
jgi:N6-L-threonylcarbamoyladenine synthase